MNFCSTCGAEIRIGIPQGDNRERHLCDRCGTVHYCNPKIIAGCIPVWNEQVLLCRRAIEPRHGLWTLPAGFMELGETLTEAALRETWEEAQAKVAIEDLYSIFNLPHVSQVYVIFRGRLLDGAFGVGEESLEVRLFDEANIPWAELAFETVRRSLRNYFADRAAGAFAIRMEDIVPAPSPTLR